MPRQLCPDERLFAFLDDVCLTTKPDRAGAGCTILEEELRVHACIRIHMGKTMVWNQARVRPPVCDVLERMAWTGDPTATVWKGLGLLEEEQGIKVLGSPLGHPAFVARHLERTSVKHQMLLDRIPLVQDVQSVWLFFLHFESGATIRGVGLVLERPRVSVVLTHWASRADCSPWSTFGTLLSLLHHLDGVAVNPCL